jgi:hypothetical protein
VPNWRDELIEVVKTKAEREAEEKERHKKRVEEALTSAEAAMQLAAESLRFARDKVAEKGQPNDLVEQKDHCRFSVREVGLSVDLVRESAVIKVTFIEGKPREFDFAKDRHIAPADVEEYVGRRAVELVRAAHKAHPW